MSAYVVRILGSLHPFHSFMCPLRHCYILVGAYVLFFWWTTDEDSRSWYENIQVS
jgi:hypothetical protein